MLFGIDTAFWVGMAVIAAVVVVGCAVAWLMPPNNNTRQNEK